LFLDLPGGSAVFQKDGIIGEARIQPQAALQRNFIPGRTRTLSPMHDAASAWNAGFIRQVCNRRVLLPDKSGVPVVVSRARSHLTRYIF
jgi:hypothetical protein